MRSSVVITGMGLLSGAGANLEEARNTFLAGKCALSPIGQDHTDHLRARFAGLLNGAFAPPPLPEGWEVMDKHAVMALVAAREALLDAHLQPPSLRRRMGLVFATCSGPMLRIEEHYERLHQGNSRLTPEALHAKRYYSGAKALANALGVEGLTTTVLTACTAGASAIALAADLIRSGLLDAALAGGADAFAISTLAGFDGLKATSETRCAPFSKPVGLNLGEAAAFVVLEAAGHAKNRGARIHARLLAAGLSNDAYHCSAPDPSGRGVSAAIHRALKHGGLSAEDIHYLNAHGTGTEANDRAEVKAIRKVFGKRAETLPVSSTKSQIGHCLGAAGAAEVIASVVCAQQGVFPATANFAEPREGCCLNHVSQAGKPWTTPRTFVSINAAFGGHNAALALSLPGHHEPPQAHAIRAERILLTGCGVVSPAGIGLEPLLNPKETADAQADAGLINEQEIDRFDRRLDLRGMDRSSRWATVAARLAIRDAGFPEKPAALSTLGLLLSLGAGPSQAESEYLSSYFANERKVAQLTPFPYIVPCSVAGNVCRALRLSGHNLTLSGGPHAGLLGLVPAWSALRCAQSDSLLCGAVDELTERILADEREAGRLRPPQRTRPGEGAALLMLETERHARRREARALAELCAATSSTEITHPHHPDPDARVLRETVAEALSRAGIEPHEVALICAAGSPDALHPGLAPFWENWQTLVFSRSTATGDLEASQPLIDLANALRSPRLPPGTGLLAVSRSPHGVNGVAVFKKIA